MGTAPATSHRSASQYKEYLECPYRFKLKRIDRKPEKKSVWAPQGTGVHAAAEAHERSGRTLSTEEAQDVFIDSYTTEINKQCAEVPNFDHWFSSGRYRAREDIERRFQLGLEQVSRYVAYYRDIAPHEQIWTAPDGTPAIELEFDIVLGTVRVRGILDQAIAQYQTPAAHVRDIKTGKLPGDDFQIAVYAEALRQTYGVRADTGDYWMGTRGRPTKPYNVAEWSTERLTEAFEWLDTEIRSENFEPSPEPSKCRRCPVQESCSFFASKVDT